MNTIEAPRVANAHEQSPTQSVGSGSSGSADSIFERIFGRRIPALRRMGLNMLATMTEAEAEAELRKIGDIDCVLTDEPWGKGYPPNWHATLEHRRSRVVLTQGHGATRRGALIHALCDWRWQNTHWFYREKFPGQPDRPCSFKAKRDGYCFRHHPSDLKRTLECRRVRLTAQLAAVDAELARITPADGPGNPS